MFAPKPESLSVQLSSDYSVNASLAVWAHALLNTDVYPLQEKPPWFDNISIALTNAKNKTLPWPSKDYPSIASGLPQSLIDYGTKFNHAANELIPLFEKPLTADDRETAIALIDVLKDEAVTQQFRVKGLQNKVEAFAKSAQETAVKLSTAQRDVMATIKTMSADLVKLQSRITDLYRELGVSATDAKNEMSGVATKGLSIAGSLFVYTIASAVTATASAPIISVGIGVLALTYAAIMEKAHSDAVLTRIREITELQAKIPVEQQQAASLQALVSAIDSLSDLTRMSQANMAGSVHYWDDVTSGLVLAQEILAQNTWDPRALTPFTTMAGAKASWQSIVAAAKNVQKSVFALHPPVVVKGEAA